MAAIDTMSIIKTFIKNKERGAALMIVVFFFVTISIAIVQSATMGAIAELRTYRTLASSKFAYVAAEAGIEDIYFRTIREMQIPSTATIVLNNATSSVTVNNISATEKDIFATGWTESTYRKLFMKTSKVYSVSLLYGAQIGEGGATMNNGSKVNGLGLTDGDVHSNGAIVGGSANITGDVTVAARLENDQIASSTVCNTSEVMGQSNPKIDHAQSFVMSSTSPDTLARVSLYLMRNGNPANATLRIVADVGGFPGTSTAHTLATQVIPYSIVGTSLGWVDVNFATPTFLNPGVTYWLVFDSGQHASRYWYWCRSTADVYSLGSPVYKQDWSSALAWTALGGDLNFKLAWGGGTSIINGIAISGTAKADTITGATIGGDAYYQTISGSTVAGTSFPGSPTPSYVALPLTATAITQWKNDAENGGVITGDYTIGGGSSVQLGPRKITGNLTIENGSTLTLTGTVYATGAIVMNNNVLVKCHFDFGSRGCILMSDKSINIGNNATFGGSGSAGSYVFVLSTKQGCLGPGSSTLECTTNNSAIAISNNVNYALFYAGESMVDISNNAKITAVVGYKLSLSNNTEIIYDGALMDMGFQPSATGTTGSWNVSRWNEF